MKTELEEKLISDAISCGATKATILSQDKIVLSASFRDICASNSCGGYGKCWMCPPDIGDIHVLMEKVRSYQKALLFQLISPLEDSFDFEGMADAADTHCKICRELRKKAATYLPSDSFYLACGGCHICERCAKRDNLPCRFPDEAQTSLEACGIDVSATTKDTDLKYINGQNTVTYFGMILFNEN